MLGGLVVIGGVDAARRAVGERSGVLTVRGAPVRRDRANDRGACESFPEHGRYSEPQPYETFATRAPATSGRNPGRPCAATAGDESRRAMATWWRRRSTSWCWTATSCLYDATSAASCA